MRENFTLKTEKLIPFGAVQALSGGMVQPTNPDVYPNSRPICIGMTCWRWQKTKAQVILGLAQRLEVKVQLTERISGLRRHIEAEITGRNTDRFIGEFVRHC